MSFASMYFIYVPFPNSQLNSVPGVPPPPPYPPLKFNKQSDFTNHFWSNHVTPPHTSHPKQRLHVFMSSRLHVRQLTGFRSSILSPPPPSVDAVSDRDFVIELLSANSITAIHLSRIAEEWVLWATEEFGFLTPSDRVSTGSSIMPQKKNPDPMELARGKSARVVGDLMTMLVLCKGLPLAYNRDLQVSHQRGCCYYIRGVYWMRGGVCERVGGRTAGVGG